MNDDERHVANAINDALPAKPDAIDVVQLPHYRVGFTIDVTWAKPVDEYVDPFVLKALLDGDFDTDVVSYTFTVHENTRANVDEHVATYTYIVTDYMS